MRIKNKLQLPYALLKSMQHLKGEVFLLQYLKSKMEKPTTKKMILKKNSNRKY